MVRIVFANAFGPSNRGDAALIERLVAEMKGALGELPHVMLGIATQTALQQQSVPEIEWIAPPVHASSSAPLRRRIEKALRLGTIMLYILSGGRPLVRHLLSNRQRRACLELEAADLVVSVPGGFIVDNHPNVLSQLSQLWLAAMRRRPILLAPQSIGPIHSRLLRWITAHVLEQAQMICLREPDSMDFVRNELRLRRPRLVRMGDMAFHNVGSDAEAGARILNDELGVGANDRFIAATAIDWSFRHAQDRKKRSQSYIEALGHALANAARRYGLKVVLLNQVSADLPAARRVAEIVGPAAVVDCVDRTPAELCGMFARAEMSITSRFHSCIFSLLQGTPAIAIAYLWKTTGIWTFSSGCTPSTA
jgi:colanic acid/amylovoran biosynthesis protein